MRAYDASPVSRVNMHFYDFFPAEFRVQLLSAVETERFSRNLKPHLIIEISTNGSTTLSRINLSGYVGHASIFIVQCSLLRAVSRRVRVRIRG